MCPWILNKKRKEFSLCHKINFSNPYIFETWWCKHLIFQTIWSNRIQSISKVDYTASCNIIGIKNQSMWQKFNSFETFFSFKFFNCELSRRQYTESWRKMQELRANIQVKYFSGCFLFFLNFSFSKFYI